MNKKQKQALANVIASTRDYIKLAHTVVQREFGEEIQKRASETADALIKSGWLKEEDRAELVDKLVYNRKSVLGGLKKMADESSLIPVGAPTEKRASDDGIFTKYGTVKPGSADKLWKSRWGSIE